MFRRRREDGFFSGLGRWLTRLFALVGFWVIIGGLIALGEARPSMPDKMILTYTFKPGIVETISKPSFEQPLLHPTKTFHEIIDNLTAAAKDKRVKGFVARLQDVSMPPAQIQELRAAIIQFRAAGKFAYIYSDDFGGMGPGMGDYYLASSFEQIWLQPVGGLSVTGIVAEVPFFKGILDKIGVEADFVHKGIYKSAPESLTETGMSAPHREMMTGLVNDIASQIIAGIAADRGMTESAVRRIVDGAPYSDEEALKLKLVDRLGYYDQVIEAARAAASDKDMETVDLGRYSFKGEKFPGEKKSNAKIALIFGSGEIVPYSRGAHSGLSGIDMPADKIIKAFEDVQKDKDVAAVVFRVDSPGGSPGAAESIRRAVIATQQKGKPVIVSMGGNAASGGYWLAAPADKIVAQPGTITGSIGVFGGKFVLAQLWEKLGVNWNSVQSGDNARIWSVNNAFTPQEKARVEFLMNNIYEAFISRVMEGRKLTREQVMAVAEGHVWTGRQAKERGLVDELGGLDRAVMLAKVAARLEPDEDIPVQRFPSLKSPVEMFIDLVMEGASIMPAIKISAADVLQRLQVATDRDVLRAPDVILW